MQSKSRGDSSTMKTATVANHLEQNLGQISRGWGGFAAHLGGLRVCLFEDKPVTGVDTYSTLGLSDHVLRMPHGRTVRQELLLSVHERFAGSDLPNLLSWVSESVIGSHSALLRGEVVELGHPIRRASQCRALYVAAPVAFPDGLAVFRGTAPPTVFAWLVPIGDSEQSVVSATGWSEFERQLEAAKPDLYDLDRASIVK